MYPDVNVFLQLFTNPGEHDAKRLLLNMLTTMLYLGLPLLWSGMMAWVGVHLGRSMDSVSNSFVNVGREAGRQGGAIARFVVPRKLR